VISESLDFRRLASSFTLQVSFRTPLLLAAPNAHERDKSGASLDPRKIGIDIVGRKVSRSAGGSRQDEGLFLPGVKPSARRAVATSHRTHRHDRMQTRMSGWLIAVAGQSVQLWQSDQL
jgi:hypothetical protein